MEGISTTEDRIDYLTTHYDLSTRNAKALIVAEMGYSHSAIARVLDVTEGTAKKYLRRLEDRIGEGVTESLPKSGRFKTFPQDGEPKGEPRYSCDYIPQKVNKGESLDKCLANLSNTEQA